MHRSRGRCARIQYMRLVVGAVHVGKGWEELAEAIPIAWQRFQSLGSDSNRLAAIAIAWERYRSLVCAYTRSLAIAMPIAIYIYKYVYMCCIYKLMCILCTQRYQSLDACMIIDSDTHRCRWQGTQLFSYPRGYTRSQCPSQVCQRCSPPPFSQCALPMRSSWPLFLLRRPNQSLPPSRSRVGRSGTRTNHGGGQARPGLGGGRRSSSGRRRGGIVHVHGI